MVPAGTGQQGVWSREELPLGGVLLPFGLEARQRSPYLLNTTESLAPTPTLIYTFFRKELPSYSAKGSTWTCARVAKSPTSASPRQAISSLRAPVAPKKEPPLKFQDRLQSSRSAPQPRESGPLPHGPPRTPPKKCHVADEHSSGPTGVEVKTQYVTHESTHENTTKALSVAIPHGIHSPTFRSSACHQRPPNMWLNK